MTQNDIQPARSGLSVLAVAATLVGCTDTSFPEATGEGVVRGVNGIVNTVDVRFLIEEREIDSGLPYKSATPAQSYDDLTYTFNFDLPQPLADPRRLASRFVDVIRDTDYTFVLAGTVDAPEVVLWERPVRAWDGSETVFELGFGHVSNTVGEVDVYFAAPGTAPALGNAVGSVAFGGRLADTEYASGDYEIILTARDDPNTVLYQSASVTLASSNSYTVAVFDADPSIAAPISVRLINLGGTSTELPDANFPPTQQFVHAAFGTGNVDVVVDGDFGNPLLADLPFGEVSGDIDVPEGPATYAFAPTGNTMVLVDDEDRSFLRGTRFMTRLLGEPGSLQTVTLSSQRRGFSTVARFRLTNASVNAQAIDVYFTDPGESIDDRNPNLVSLPFAGVTPVTQQLAQDFEITVTANGEKTPLVGPVPLTLATEDVVEMIVLDTADPNVAALTIFSNVNP